MMTNEEIVELMREHAALVNLEAEVILALKAYQANYLPMLEEQIAKIVVSLNRVEEVRRRNREAEYGNDAGEES
jgi:predicted aconitase with swiveling domain